jgi:HD-like signal output (HDOD) protein
VDLSPYGFADKGLWKNAVATAAVARAVALRAKVSQGDSETYFAAALLRDIGMLVLSPFLAQRQVRLSAQRDAKDRDVQRRERNILGFDHCGAGERVADKWTLPASIRLCISHHHRIPPTAKVEELRLLASVRLAERLVYAAGIGMAKDHPFDIHLEPVLIHASGLDASRFEDLVRELPQIVKTAEM